MPSKHSAENYETSALATRLARNIAAHRHRLKLTQAQLAEQLGVDTETLSRFERGKHLPSLLTLEKLASLLLTTIGELLEEVPKAADNEALMLSAWLSRLQAEDREFTTELLKQCCFYLDERGKRSYLTIPTPDNESQT